MIVQEYKLLPGGAQKAITATPIAVDLTNLVGYKVLIYSLDQNIRFCAQASASPTTLLADSTDTTASDSAMVAYQVAKGFAVPFEVTRAYPFIIVATDTGSGNLKVKPVAKVELV